MRTLKYLQPSIGVKLIRLCMMNIWADIPLPLWVKSCTELLEASLQIEHLSLSAQDF